MVRVQRDAIVGTRTIFFFFFFPSDVFFFLSFFSQGANRCFPFIIINYFAQYSCIACIMLLKPMLARSPGSFRNRDNKCFLVLFFFINNSNKKILAPHALDVAVIISSLIASLRFTFAIIKFHCQVKLCIGQRKYKQKSTT